MSWQNGNPVVSSVPRPHDLPPRKTKVEKPLKTRIHRPPIPTTIFFVLIMTPQQKAESLGLTFTKQAPGYLNLCIRSGNQLLTSGHVSDLKGKLGAGVSTEDGYKAAKNCAEKVLRSVWDTHGTLDGLKVIKVLGCVNSTLDYSDQHLVINGCSDLLHEIFGKEGDGYHARSALGFAQLPTGAAVEVEAIFEIKA